MSYVINNVFFSNLCNILLYVTAFMNQLNKHPRQAIDPLLIRYNPARPWP